MKTDDVYIERAAEGADRGLVGDENVIVTVTGIQKGVGSSANDFMIEWADTTTEYHGNIAKAAEGDETATALSTNYTVEPEYGKLEITDGSSLVVVKIIGHTLTVSYNGKEQTVTGYDVEIVDKASGYTEKDFTFNGQAVAKGTEVGQYPMGLTAAMFANTNDKFEKVEFQVTDGWIKIEAPAPEPKQEQLARTADDTQSPAPIALTGMLSIMGGMLLIARRRRDNDSADWSHLA